MSTGTVLLIHLDRVVRERIEEALRLRGLTVSSFVEVGAALDATDSVSATAVLVDPRILVKEEYDIATRFELRAGHPVRLIALTHIAGASEAQAFQRHGASLLIAPLENLDLLALYLGGGEGSQLASGGGVSLPEEETNVGRLPPGAEEEVMSPEMEAALARAREEVRRIRADHQAAQKEKPDAPPPRMPEPSMASSHLDLAAIAAPAAPDGGTPRVLVVEDDLGCRDFFQDVLAARGYHVHSCSSVPAALRYIQRGNRVDLILSDINMPIFDGFELKWMLDNEIRLAGHGAVPFLAVSAEDTPEKYSLALRLGAVALVPKPVKDLKKFCRMVRSTLERAWAPA